jgi:hypothetical protein
MSINIKPGDILELSCSGMATPQVAAGQIFPAEAKEKSFVIVSVNGSKTIVGPVRAGEFEVLIPCSDGQIIKETFNVKATPQDQLPPKQSPVLPIDLSFPIWFWIALALSIFTMCGIIFGTARYFNKKKIPVLKNNEPPPLNGDEILMNYFRTVEGARWAERDDLHVVTELYSKGNDALRAFLEHRFHFKASWATTSEFLGTLKTSLMGFSGLNELSHSVETLLSQADLVRFSKDLPPLEVRKNFLLNLRKIHADVLRATQVKTQ